MIFVTEDKIENKDMLQMRGTEDQRKMVGTAVCGATEAAKLNHAL